MRSYVKYRWGRRNSSNANEGMCDRTADKGSHIYKYPPEDPGADYTRCRTAGAACAEFELDVNGWLPSPLLREATYDDGRDGGWLGASRACGICGGGHSPLLSVGYPACAARGCGAWMAATPCESDGWGPEADGYE